MAAASGQYEHAVKLVGKGPDIDGVIDEMWADVDQMNIAQNFQTEEPTLGAEGDTYWKMVWVQAQGIYVLLVVNDEDFWPAYVTGGTSHEYDKVELYFDCNYLLKDGGGASGEGQPGNGHHQCAPSFEEGLLDGTLLDAGINGDADADDAGVKYAYMVNDPDYVAEFFFPLEYLTDENGIINDLSEPIGFDVTIIDQDEGRTESRQRAVWANAGETDESWNTMDDCGVLTFEGIGDKTYVESVEITGGAITQNNKPFRFEATVLPEDATNRNLNWTVENITGRATIDNNGVLIPILDGEVLVTATAVDGSYWDDTATVTISNQLVSEHELNLIRNGYFDDVNPATFAAEEWAPGFEVIDGALYIPAADGEYVNPWEGSRRTGQRGFGCNSLDSYYFSWVSWSESPDTFYIDFEDPANEYARYGSTSHPDSPNGTSEWQFVTTTTPTKYEMEDLVFENLLDNTTEEFNLMGGLHEAGGVYFDSIILINMNDFALISDPVAKEVETIAVTGDGGAATVSIGSTLQMVADVQPADADYTEVYWSVVDGTGNASIDDAGLLTGDSVGKVLVYAHASDDSQVMGSMEVNVSWPENVEQEVVNILKVYPNPAVGELNVVLTKPGATVAIYNSVGMKMDEAFITGTEHRFNVRNYASGLYFVKTGNMVTKFIK